MDATIINVPSATKNQDKNLDPEMHSTKKGELVLLQHEDSCRSGPGKQDGPLPRHYPRQRPRLKDGGRPFFTEKNVVFGDSAYIGKTEEITKKAPRALDLSQIRETKNKKLTEEEK